MPFAIHVFPDRSGTAAENMASDFLLLQRYRPEDAIRVRHYSWSRPAYTFGMSQKYSYVRSEIADPLIDICRRPTGGGIVSHLEDWTYSLVIPSSHPFSQEEPNATYKGVHEMILAALSSQGVEATVNRKEASNHNPGVCFNKAELFDILLKNLPTKVAGAAQKRTKSGLLFQGSIWRPTVSNLNWNRFYNDFLFELCKLLDASLSYEDWPNWTESEEKALLNQFDSDDWNHRR